METSDTKKTVRVMDVTCYDTDIAHYMKPGAFMDQAQEIAYVSADRLGFGYDDLQRYGTAWVLSRMEVHFLNTPRWRDRVELQTWHKGFEGPFYVRDFMMTASDGTTAVAATSSWLIIDIATRRLLRREHLASCLPLDTTCDESAVDAPCGKVAMPREGLVKVADHTVSYSDVDIIGHTNNAKYVVWAMDCIDFDHAASHRLKSLRINFNKETRPGETVGLYRAEVPGGWMVEGLSQGRSAFCAELLF